MYKILSINPGSTSTKFAIYDDEQLIFTHTIRHTAAELQPFRDISEQLNFRKITILECLKNNGISLHNLSAVVGRGGLVQPLQSGVYEVNDELIADLKNSPIGQHASNLGGIIAREIANSIANCQAYIADPVVVDEMQTIARISGLPELPRRSMFHALNHKATARKYAASIGSDYHQLQLVVAHLGGGISVAAHKFGKVIDTNQGLDGYGPFSPERAGTLDAGLLVNLCYSQQYTKAEILHKLNGKGGLIAHLGTNEVKVIEERANNGSAQNQLALEAMAYNVAKEIGTMLAVLKGEADAVLLTGGIAHCKLVVNFIKNMIEPMCRVAVFPGEDELEALAMNGLRVLRGEQAQKYVSIKKSNKTI